MTSLNQENAKFYDHCINSGAIGAVVAKVRQDAIKENNAYVVIACWKDSTPFWWNGGYKHALLLASTIKINGGEVRLLNPKGADVDIEKSRY